MSENVEGEGRSRPKKTVIGSFLGRIHRSKSRGSDIDKKKKEETSKVVPSSKSDGNIGNVQNGRGRSTKIEEHRENVSMSPARRLINKFSFRCSTRSRSKTDLARDHLDGKKHLSGAPPVKTTSEHDLHNINIKTPNRLQKTQVGAASEMDLRYVTSRNDHASVPIDETFGFGEKSPRGFLSETDLSSGVIDFPEVNRTPSYLRISCALNGYTRSPKKDSTEISVAASKLGESFVERRLRMFSQPQDRRKDEFSSPMVSSSSTTTTTTSQSKSSENECLTPLVKPANRRIQEMGNHVSTPAPIKDLISKFDKLDLCSASKEQKEKDVEKIEPHNIIINSQPDFDDVEDLKKDPNGNEIEEKQKENKEPLKLSLDVESDSGISGSANFSPDGNTKAEELTKVPENGEEFRKLHDKMKLELEKKMEEASKDLENVDDIPEKCADSLRASHGNAHLLVRKKFGKFNELIEKHINPLKDDPMPVNLPDLEAFWMTIEMELEGIRKEFEKVEKYREANWDVNAVAEEVDEKIVETPKLKKPSGNTNKKKTPVAVSAEAKEKLEKQRAAAEQRRAEMRAQMKQKMQEMKENETTA